VPPATSITTLSDVGRARPRNEDAAGTDSRIGVVIVADGMGGHPAGDVASRLAVEEALERLRARYGPSQERSPQLGSDPMVEAVRSADRRLRDEVASNPTLEGMGTTLTILRVDPGSRWHIAHVGDSRAYLFRDGELTRLTRDDTWVQAQVDAGRLSEEAAKTHPRSAVLTKALGVDAPVTPSVAAGDARAGDLFLLCSDGLLAHLTDDDIAGVLRSHPHEGIDSLARLFVDRANEQGGTDNITIGLLRVDDR
jgi:serine/threonine protein phosphatase PrpC